MVVVVSDGRIAGSIFVSDVNDEFCDLFLVSDDNKEFTLLFIDVI